MRMLKLALPGAILAAGTLVVTTTSYAKPEYTKKEGKTCTFCHVKAGSKDLNDAGKYYKEHNHSLQGYKPKN
jgi:hypothetical protein